MKDRLFQGAYVFDVGDGSWNETNVLLNEEEHTATFGNEPFCIPYWGLVPGRPGLYPGRPEGTVLWSIRSNPSCKERIIDPDYTEERGHGDYGGRECCMTLVGAVIAVKEEDSDPQ